MDKLERAYNRVYDKYIEAVQENFKAKLDGTKNGDAIYLHGKIHGLQEAMEIIDCLIDKIRVLVDT